MLERFYKYLLKNQVIFALFIVAFGWILLQLKDILISLFVSYILAAALVPGVKTLRKWGVPKLLAVLLAYFGVLFLLIVLIFPLVPFLAEQIESLFNKFPTYLNESARSLGLNINARQLQTYLTQEIDTISSNAFFVTSQIFGGLFSVLTIFIVSFYLLLDHDRFKKWLASFFEKESRIKVLETFTEVDEKLGAWVRGQLVLCFFIGFISYIALSLLGVPNALPLAVLAGFLEAVPTLGPILSAIPSIIVASTQSPTLMIGVIIAYILIQMIENNFLVPKVMQRAVGLNPIIVIIAIMTGAQLLGLPGALLAIPFVSFMTVLVNSIDGEEIKELEVK